MTALEFLKQERFVAILRHIPKEYAKEAAKALYEGGIRIFEVTFNPSSPTTFEDTAEIIFAIRELYGDKVSVGAGTVVDVNYAKAAKKAGAEFVVSPCTDPKVIAYARKTGMLSCPGAYTPTEIVRAYSLGADIVKIFPVGPTEVGYLKNVTGPLSHIPFMPTGGINPDTIESFMACGPVAVAAGATIITKALVEAGEWETITANAKAHVDKIKNC